MRPLILFDGSVMKGRITSWLLVACCASATVATAAANDNPLLNEAVVGNASTVSVIQTLYAKVNFKVIPAGHQEPSLAYSAQYWREPGLVRVRDRCLQGRAGQLIEFLRTEGQQRAVTRLPRQQPNTFTIGLRIAKEWRPTILTDVWKLALMGIPPMDTEEKPPLPISEALRQMKLKRVTAESGPNGRLTRLTLADDDDTYDVWLDPAVNWLVRKVVRQRDKSPREPGSRSEYTIADFREVQPGIFFPTKMTLQYEVNGKHSVTHEAEFSDVKINQLHQPPFPLKLPLYGGMPATDEIAGTTYMVDADGKPTGKVKALRYAPAPVAAMPDPNTQPGPSWLRHSSTWLIGLSLSCAAAAAFLAYRRRRAEQAT